MKRWLIGVLAVGLLAIAAFHAPAGPGVARHGAPSRDELRAALASASVAFTAPGPTHRTAGRWTRGLLAVLLRGERRMRPHAAALLAAVRQPASDSAAARGVASAVAKLRHDVRALRSRVAEVPVHTRVGRRARRLLRDSLGAADQGLAAVSEYAQAGRRASLARAPHRFSTAAAKGGAAARLLGCTTTCGRLF